MQCNWTAFPQTRSHITRAWWTPHQVSALSCGVLGTARALSPFLVRIYKFNRDTIMGIVVRILILSHSNFILIAWSLLWRDDSKFLQWKSQFNYMELYFRKFMQNLTLEVWHSNSFTFASKSGNDYWCFIGGITSLVVESLHHFIRLKR